MLCASAAGEGSFPVTFGFRPKRSAAGVLIDTGYNDTVSNSQIVCIEQRRKLVYCDEFVKAKTQSIPPPFNKALMRVMRRVVEQQVAIARDLSARAPGVPQVLQICDRPGMME